MFHTEAIRAAVFMRSEGPLILLR